ncbi:MAG TPA: EamA family transporter [Vicinamibacteria bacterium]|nr:EamA family transporter [Vicinamibacteria bacterium]
MITPIRASFAAFLPELLATLRTAPIPSTLVVLFLGVGPSAVAYLAWAHTVSKMSVSAAVGYLYLVPILALALGWLLLDEAPRFLALAGGATTPGGVALVRQTNARRARQFRLDSSG